MPAPYDRTDLDTWVVEAIRSLGGRASVVDIAKEIWKRHEDDLRASGDLFYTWQYEYRWSGKRLRDNGKLRAAEVSPRGVWVLA